MIRLKFLYNNKEWQVIKRGNQFSIIETNRNVVHYGTGILSIASEEQNTSDILEKENRVSTYTKFIEIIRTSTSKKIPAHFLIVENNGEFYIFKSPYYAGYFLLTVYKPENQYMQNYIERLLCFNGEKNFIILNSDPINHFAFITTWQILKLLLAKASVESEGEKPFESFQKPKKTGGMRTIYAPNKKIKDALRELNALLQTVYDGRNADFQIAYKKGKNIKTGANIHKENKYVYNIDLHDFYPSCKKELVERYVSFLFAYSYNRDFIEKEFFNIILINDGLFIGSPISGTLANAIISNSVHYMNNICKKHNMKISVYADDITFSSNKFISKEYVLGIFNEGFAKYKLDTYYTINEKKCVGFSKGNRKITGVSVNENDKITVSRKYYRELRTQIDHLSKGDSNINIGKLRGKIAYATMIDDSGKIYNYLNKFLPIVKQYHLCSDEKLEELKSRI